MPDTEIISLYGEITKKDAAQRLVQGYISSEQVDLAGQIVDQNWLKGALPRYMAYGNVREQHRADKAVGRAKEVDTTTEPGPLLTAKIVDRDAWEKVEEGVYNGFSIGVKNPIIVKDAEAPRGRIVGGELIEISIVDRPCNNESLFTLVKAVGAGEWKDMQTGVVIEDLTKRDFSSSDRKHDAKSGAALPDGSFPIESKQDLENAIHAYGRAKDKAKAKAHIISRAKALGATAMLPDDWKAVEGDLEKSRPKHSHPYVGTHNHTHAHMSYDGKTITHTHPHIHEDDDIHEHEHRPHAAAEGRPSFTDSTTSGSPAGLPVLKEANLDNDQQKAVEQAVEIEKTVEAEQATEQVEEKAVEAKAADGEQNEPVTKAAPDAIQGESSPIARPGRFSSELTAIQEALSRLQALAGQTDKDKDGDIDFDDASAQPDKTEEGEFRAQRPSPDSTLINPGAQTLSFASMTDLVKGLLEDETFRTTLRSEIETVSGETYVAKAAEVDAANQTSIDGLAEVSGNLVKGLGLVAEQAETSAKGLDALKADLAKAAVEIERIKELAQPSKGISHVVEKGMLGAADRFTDFTSKSADPAAVAVELSKMSEQDRIAFAAQGLKGIYGR